MKQEMSSRSLGSFTTLDEKDMNECFMETLEDWYKLINDKEHSFITLTPPWNHKVPRTISYVNRDEYNHGWDQIAAVENIHEKLFFTKGNKHLHRFDRIISKALSDMIIAKYEIEMCGRRKRNTHQDICVMLTRMIEYFTTLGVVIHRLRQHENETGIEYFFKRVPASSIIQFKVRRRRRKGKTQEITYSVVPSLCISVVKEEKEIINMTLRDLDSPFSPDINSTTLVKETVEYDNKTQNYSGDPVIRREIVGKKECTIVGESLSVRFE